MVSFSNLITQKNDLYRKNCIHLAAKTKLNIFHLFLVDTLNTNKEHVTPELKTLTARQNSR